MADGKTAARKGTANVRMHNGQKVIAVLYNGKHGKYMSGWTSEGQLISDGGKPLPLQRIGSTNKANNKVIG